MESIINVISANWQYIISTFAILLTTILIIATVDIALKKLHYSRHGIYGPMPLPFVGNLHQMTFGKRSELEIEWRNTYGKVYVTFLGSSPRLTVADAQLMRDICITNFKSFTDTNSFSSSNRFDANSLFFLKGDRWRKARSLMTPTFTSGKIKRMFKLLLNTSQDLVETVKETIDKYKSNDKLNGEDLKAKISTGIYHLYALKSMALSCYAIDINRNGLLNLDDICKVNVFVDSCIKLDNFPFWSQVIGFVLPAKIIPLFTSHFKRRYNCMLRLENQMKSILKLRSGKHDKYSDILSNMCSARIGDKLEFINNTEKDVESHHEGYTGQESLSEVYKEMYTSISNNNNTSQEFQLTDDELYANLVLMLPVGVNTANDVMTAAMYCIAFHNEIQARLYNELTAIKRIDDSGHSIFEYEELISNQYLDAVLSEVSRLYGAVIFTDRECTEDFLLEKYNLVIKKGDVVHLSMHSLHTDPDYWPNPEEFNPERFMPQNKDQIVAGSYCPFGLGPRQCVGMRFALTKIKIGIAKLITEFEFFPIEGSKFPPIEGYSSFIRALGDLSVYAKRR